MNHYFYITAKDRTLLRCGIWPCDLKKLRGSVVLVTGRAEFMEKYQETIDELNDRGFRVFSFDWRGQGLSGRLLKNRHKGYIYDFNDYVSDFKQMINEVVMPWAVRPLILMGHSMGGHISLRFLHHCPDVFDKAVLISPMFDIKTSPYPRRLARWFTQLVVKAGLAKSYIVGTGDYHESKHKFERNDLTSDPKRFHRMYRIIRNNPYLALGGVTFGWVDAAFRSIDMIRTPGYLSQIIIPVLIIAGDKDSVVSLKEIKAVSESLLNGRLKMIGSARHEVLMETDLIRSVFWDSYDSFAQIERIYA